MSARTRILITGATGFVGEHLIRALEEGASDFEITGTSFPAVPWSDETHLLFLDLRSREDVLKTVREVQPNWIFHLAAISNVRCSWTKRSETIETNVLGTHNLLEAIRLTTPAARMLFIGSSDVYGTATPPARLISEVTPLQINSPYAFSKAASEMLCDFYDRVENIDIVIARPFPHTGPGQKKDFVCSDWARQIALIERGDRDPVLKVGNIDVQRDFCDVRDVVKAYMLLMSRGRRGEAYNVSSRKAVSLREVLGILIKKASVGSPLSVLVDPPKLRKGDSPINVGDNSKITRETGWSPTIPLDRTLGDLLDYWRRELAAEADESRHKGRPA